MTCLSLLSSLLTRSVDNSWICYIKRKTKKYTFHYSPQKNEKNIPQNCLKSTIIQGALGAQGVKLTQGSIGLGRQRTYMIEASPIYRSSVRTTRDL